MSKRDAWTMLCQRKMMYKHGNVGSIPDAVSLLIVVTLKHLRSDPNLLMTVLIDMLMYATSPNSNFAETNCSVK